MLSPTVPQDGPPDSKRGALDHPPLGSLIGGKFQLVKVIGEGAMGVVLEARHRELNQRVAVKFLRRDMLSRPDVVQRFDREAKIAAQLHGEHVARVLDVGSEGGQPFILMEYLRGGSVAQLLASSSRLSIETAASYAIEACAGLAEAHAAGIVHRDIKPENLFLVAMPDGSHKIKILDFGVSKIALTGVAFEGDGSRTDTMVGSPFYMSPEQVRAQPVTTRSDLWSLGATLFEMIAGRPPFEASSLMHVCSMVLEAPIPDVRAFRPDCPDALAETIARCLRRDPAGRFASAGELATELVAHASARAALVADIAVALSRDARPGHASERSGSMLDLHLALRSGSGSTPGSSVRPAAITAAPPASTGQARPVAALAGLLLLGGSAFWAASRGAPSLPPSPSLSSPSSSLSSPSSSLSSPSSSLSSPSSSSPSSPSSSPSSSSPSSSSPSSPSSSSPSSSSPLSPPSPSPSSVTSAPVGAAVNGAGWRPAPAKPAPPKPKLDDDLRRSR